MVPDERSKAKRTADFTRECVHHYQCVKSLLAILGEPEATRKSIDTEVRILGTWLLNAGDAEEGDGELSGSKGADAATELVWSRNGWLNR